MNLYWVALDQGKAKKGREVSISFLEVIGLLFLMALVSLSSYYQKRDYDYSVVAFHRIFYTEFQQ